MRKLVFILGCILLTSCLIKEVKKTQPRIEIKINANQEVFLNGENVVLEDISKKILSITSNDTVNDAKYYVICLDIDEDVNVSTVTEIKQEVRKGKVLRVEYK